MRLSADQLTTIRQLVIEYLGSDTRISVYGSRLDERRKGGDLDLLLETSNDADPLQRAGLKLALESALYMPVDLLVRQRDAPITAFQAIALAKAVYLEQPA
jgi:predicted nucleotidyltransferase